MFIQGNILSRPRGKEGIWWMRGGVLGQVSQKKTLRWYYARMWFIKGMLRGETGEGVWAAERGQAKLWFHAQSQPDPWGSSGMLSDYLRSGPDLRQESWIFRPPPSLVIGSQAFPALQKRGQSRSNSWRQASAKSSRWFIRRAHRSWLRDRRNGEGDPRALGGTRQME